MPARSAFLELRAVIIASAYVSKLSLNGHTHARQSRQCLCCRSGALGDKRHLLLKCPEHAIFSGENCAIVCLG